MKLVHSWAQEFVKMPKPEKVRQIFDTAGLCVDDVVAGTAIPDTVVVGFVKEAEKHPNADRLKVTTVDVGSDLLTIVCGAPNVAANQKVAVALPGTSLPNGMKLEKATIRGVASNGMICSGAELGLSSDHTGILVLPSKAIVGKPAGAYLGSGDVVYDIAVSPNRPDCLSVIGLAREVAAAMQQPTINLQPPTKASKTSGKSSVRVTIQKNTDCPFYSAQYLANVHRGPSPDWMQQRLRLAGVRPIDVVVDVTNYVMLELGQPLHAFDADRINSQPSTTNLQQSTVHILVRQAKDGESFQTLDGVNRTLDRSMLVITDGNVPIALAGVMGGEQSGVGETTTNVILESALFAKQSVYDTSHTLKLVSESSQRFSKGIDPAVVVPAIHRATELLVKFAKAEPVGGVVTAGKLPAVPKPINVSVRWLNAFLGTSLSRTAIVPLLKRLAMTVRGAGDRLLVQPPTFRHDLAFPEDIAEEVARSINFNVIPRTLPKAEVHPVPLSKHDANVRQLRQLLAQLGSHEHVGYAYVPESFVTDKTHAVRITNPLSRVQEFLRTSLEPGLLAVASMNAKRYDAFSLFEFGNAYRRESSKFAEQPLLSALWHMQDAARHAKGAFHYLLAHLWPEIRLTVTPGSHGTAELRGNGKSIGTLHLATPAERENYKLPYETALLSLNLDALLHVAHGRPRPVFRPIPAFPPVKRDIAFWIDRVTPYQAVADAFKHAGPLLIGVELFDVYEQHNRRSLAFHLTFQSSERTLTAAEIDEQLHTFTRQLAERCGAVLRRSS